MHSQLLSLIFGAATKNEIKINRYIDITEFIIFILYRNN